MHRAEASGLEHPPAMRVVGSEPFDVVRQARRTRRQRVGAYASHRRAVFADAVLRKSADGGGLGRESQMHPKADAFDGHRGDLSQAKVVAAERGTSDLPLFTAEYGDYSSQPGVGQRHHLRADAARLDVLDGGDGLAQPLRVVVAVVEHDRRIVLRGGACRGTGELRQAGYFQHRSGRAVHGRRVHQSFGIGGRGDQHGRPRPLDGQRVRGTVVADVEVRIYLPSRPCHAPRVASWVGAFPVVLQRRTVS